MEGGDGIHRKMHRIALILMSKKAKLTGKSFDEIKFNGIMEMALVLNFIMNGKMTLDSTSLDE